MTSTRNRTSGQRRGFTLVELLVVVAIIAVLAGILVPMVAAARAKAQQTTCMSNQRQIGIAVNMWAHDHADHYPGMDAWQQQGVEMGLNGKMLTCQAQRDLNAVGYAYNGRLADAEGGSLLRPDRTLVLADGHLPTATMHEDIDYRHRKHAVATFIDGHIVACLPRDVDLFYPGDQLASADDVRLKHGIELHAAAADLPVILRELNLYGSTMLRNKPANATRLAPLITRIFVVSSDEIPPGTVPDDAQPTADLPGSFALYNGKTSGITLVLTDTADDVSLRRAFHAACFLVFLQPGGLATPAGEWTGANPPGFTYAPSPSASLEPSDKLKTVLASYGAAGVEADATALYANLMVDPAYVEARGDYDPAIKAKTALLKRRLAVYNPAMDDGFWDIITISTRSLRPRTQDNASGSGPYIAIPEEE